MNDHQATLRTPIPCSLVAGLQQADESLSDIAQHRRDQIMDAAESIIAGQGIHRLSLALIEQSAGMSRGQLTYYFPTKESILLAVFERVLRRLFEQIHQEDGPKPMTGRAWDCFRHGLSHHLDPNAPTPVEQDLFSLLYTFLAQMGHRADYRNRLSHLYQGWRGFVAADVESSTPIDRPVSPNVAASMVLALIHGLCMQLAVDPNAFDREQMLVACFQLMAPLFGPQPTDSASKRVSP